MVELIATELDKKNYRLGQRIRKILYDSMPHFFISLLALTHGKYSMREIGKPNEVVGDYISRFCDNLTKEITAEIQKEEKT